MQTTTNSLARAFRQGFILAYDQPLRKQVKETFMETLDDMAVALTRKAVDEGYEDCKRSAWLLGAILEGIDEAYRKPKKGRKQ